MPNIKELLSLIDYGQSVPPLPPGHPFSGLQGYFYWSSSTLAYNPSLALSVYFDFGTVGYRTKDVSYNVWPVRGGQ